MSRQPVLNLIYSLGASLLLLTCGAPAAGPTPDLVATEVAVQKAAAATLTAEAPEPVSATAELSPTSAAAISPATATPTLPAVGTLSPTAAPGNTATPAPLCKVTANALNLRLGPGTVYEPPVGSLSSGAELEPLAFNPNGFPEGQWLQVRVLTSGQVAWVSAASQFVACNIDLTTLTPGSAPPTPTPTATNTPAPQPPTPTRPLLAIVPVDGGQSNLKGHIALPGYAPNQVTSPMVFRDKLVFQVVVYNPEAGSADGAGIDNVKITIRRESDNQQVYERTERTAGYCVFGGGEPDCNVLVFAQNGNRWPESNQPIEDGDYRAFMLITTSQGQTEQWNWGFQIEGLNTKPSTIKMKLVQVGPGNTTPDVNNALIFQVEAYDANKGNKDGAGIASVDLKIFSDDQGGRTVYERTEKTAAYCAFGGGEPHCNVWNFAQNGNKWPNGEPIKNGSYTLQATAQADNGSTASLSTEITIQIK